MQADAALHFTPMHKVLKVQFPDLRVLDCRVDFCVKAFSAVVKLCKVSVPPLQCLCRWHLSILALNPMSIAWRNLSISDDSALIQESSMILQELGIRHPEELGFTRPLSQDHLKKNYRHVGVPPRQRTIAGQGVLNLEKHGSPGAMMAQNGHDKTLLNSSLNSTTCSFNNSAYLENNYLAQYQHPLAMPYKPPNDIKVR